MLDIPHSCNCLVSGKSGGIVIIPSRISSSQEEHIDSTVLSVKLLHPLHFTISFSFQPVPTTKAYPNFLAYHSIS